MTSPKPPTGNGQSQQLAPGQMFGVPKYGTQRRMVPDNQNQALGATVASGSQTVLQTGKLDQLDIVQGEKLYGTWSGAYVNPSAGAFDPSPFGLAAAFASIQFKLQAAYNTFNLTGPLASIIQNYRPQWGSRVPAANNAVSDPFATNVNVLAGGNTPALPFHIDVPFAIKIDEYFDLTAQGDPARKILDAIVSPVYMAAQARVVMPTILLSPALSVDNGLIAPVSQTGSQNGTFSGGAFSGTLLRDAYWTAANAAANPPQYPWLYTRDYFQQPTQGQGKVGVLIQNTGVSVGQVLSLWGFVWDPAAKDGLGDVVPLSSIAEFELVTGGSLQNLALTPQALEDRMWSRNPNLLTGICGPNGTATGPGAFVLDFALSADGAYLSNAEAINTYLVNGVQLNITFNTGSAPSSSATVYLGVEALKLATS